MRLSVIVTVVDAGESLRLCLAALRDQRDPPEMEILVPCDDSEADVADVVAGFAGVKHLPLGTMTTAAPIRGYAGQHELFDRRRAAGLAAARGELVAILEDRGQPRPDWARAASDAHAARPDEVIGGAVENGADRALNWAVYFCDFGRYQLPLVAGPAAWATDVNICYKRAALDRTRDLWKDRYHETTVHWALQRSGATLRLDPAIVVDQRREGLRLGPALSERCSWGRLFAYTRAREVSAARRAAFAVLTPALPFLLLARHGRLQWTKRRTFGRFLRVAPIVFLLVAAWSVGEFVGYATGRP